MFPKKSSFTKSPITKKEGLVKKKKVRTWQNLRGFKDYLVAEQPFWQEVRQVAEKLARDYSYKMIETPIVEHLGLFKRSLGDNTDVVSKEMFIFKDKSGDSVALRPEGTASIVRAYIQHGMIVEPQPVKLWYWGPMFRYERPQSGRLRQFHQFGFEAIGDAHPILDAQQIMICHSFFQYFGVNILLQVNSIGHEECRGEYIKKLTAYYRSKKTKLCVDCKKRLTVNPLRLLDCKESGCEAFKEEVPQIVDHLCDGCREHFVKVLEYLDEAEVPYQLNPQLVRGLDYYTKTVFEIWPNKEGVENKSQNSLGGGGRYDGLVEMLGERPTPAVGFSIGIERSLLAIRDAGYTPKQNNQPNIFVAQLGDQARREAFKLFEELRQRNYAVCESFSKDGLKAQLESANRMKVKYTLIIGQKELLEGTIIIRDMESGIQEIVDRKKILAELTKKIAGEEELK